jgi:ubiquinone/menaquinone biosynthesis C-methylase UbiE
MLTGLPQSGPTDPLKYYRHPLVGRIYRERINRGLRMLPVKRYERALEVGYGAGAVLIALANGVQELHGIDLDADPSILTNYFNGSKCHAQLQRGNVYDLPYDSNFFDLVVSFSVFEHLQEYQKALGEVYRVLRPQGLFLLGMPSVNKLMEAGFFAIGHKGINELHITRPSDVQSIMQSVGFKQLEANYLDYPWPSPLGLRLYYNWLLEKSAD